MDKTWSALLSRPDAEEFIRHAFELKKLPELSVLDGIAEREDYHPEKDCGVHMRMVLRQAFKLSRDLPPKRRLRVRAAAALHDLGKAVSGGRTPDDRGETREFDPETASHLEHDKLGLRLVEDVGRRWDLDSEALEFCLQVALRHQALHRLCEKDGQLDRGSITLLTNLLLSSRASSAPIPQLALAWREREWAEDFCMAIKADSFGRLIPESERVYPQERLLMSAWEALARSRSRPWPLADRDLARAKGSIDKTAEVWKRGLEPAASERGEPEMAQKPRPTLRGA